MAGEKEKLCRRRPTSKLVHSFIWPCILIISAQGMDLFREFEQHLPEYVDSLLLSAVAGITRL